VKVALPVVRPVAVEPAELINVPHFVVVATMVAVKGLDGKMVRGPGHVTVFPLVVLVVHWILESLSSTETLVNPASGGNVSTMGKISMQASAPGHRCVMVKVI